MGQEYPPGGKGHHIRVSVVEGLGLVALCPSTADLQDGQTDRQTDRDRQTPDPVVPCSTTPLPAHLAIRLSKDEEGLCVRPHQAGHGTLQGDLGCDGFLLSPVRVKGQGEGMSRNTVGGAH